MSASGKKVNMTQLSAELRSMKQALVNARQAVQPKKAKSKKKGGTKMSTGANDSYRMLPAARGYTGQMSKFMTSSIPNHREFGPGVRVVGCEAAIAIRTTDSVLTPNLFASQVGTAGNNDFDISPDTFNGRLALIARTYTRFRFRRIKAHFVPALGVTNPGLAVIGYVHDATTGFLGTDFNLLSQTVPSKVFSLNAPASFDLLDYRGDEAYWTELDANSLAGVRQTTQGSLLGHPLIGNYGNLTHGLLWLEYEIELYGPVMDYSFAIQVKDTEEREAMQKALATFRRNKVSDTEWDTGSVRGLARR